MDEPSRSDDSFLRTGRLVIAIATVLLASGVCLYGVWRIANDPRFWNDIVFNHFAAIIGIPAAAGAAFALVTLLRQLEGPMELDILTVKLKGSSGQVVLWALCFMTFVASLELLWD